MGDEHGEILPVRDRAEAFMEEDEFRSAQFAGAYAEDFEAAIVYGKE